MCRQKKCHIAHRPTALLTVLCSQAYVLSALIII